MVDKKLEKFCIDFYVIFESINPKDFKLGVSFTNLNIISEHTNLLSYSSLVAL